MTVVTYAEMKSAIKVADKRMSNEDVELAAQHLLDFFGYNQEIIDNRLDVDDRKAFYVYQELGLVTTRQEEVYIKKHKLWRIHYWELNTRRIKELANNGHDEEERIQVGSDGVDYKDVPAEVWTRRKET